MENKKYGNEGMTLESLDEMKARAELLEDELLFRGGKLFEATGKLNDPELCDKSLEYENLTLEIIKAEEERIKKQKSGATDD